MRLDFVNNYTSLIHGHAHPAIVDRIELQSGARTTVRQLAPPDVSTLAALSVADWIDDGRGYVYNYTSLTSTLFLVSGAID